MDLILGMACGIAVCCLIKKLQQLSDNKFTAGEEEHCKNCSFKKAVMESLDDEQA